MTFANYPGFYVTSDAASAAAERKFLLFVRVHLGLLVLAALIAGVALGTTDARRWMTVLTMGVALFVGIGLKLAKLDDRWFQCRAFAENAKSATWRFMMLPDTTEADFLTELDQIRERFSETAREIAPHLQASPEITTPMRQRKALSFDKRLDVYRRERIGQQREWYAQRARSNATSESTSFWVVVSLEAITIVLAAVVGLTAVTFNPTGALASTAAALLGWSQTKRFSDLATSYAVAAQDLSLLATRSESIADEAGLAALVQETENAISREHRMWLARRRA